MEGLRQVAVPKTIKLLIFAGFMYKLLRRLLFLFPPENVHHFSMRIFRFACSIGFIGKSMRTYFGTQEAGGVSFEKKIFGLTFRNPVGLGAGFDKNASYLDELEILGFGFVEIGTVTPLPQPGNPQPRLFRLPKDKALVNRMGFNNDGVMAVAKKLRNWKEKNNVRNSLTNTRLIIGGNIGKNKTTPNEDAWKDYEACFRELGDCVDYFVVNVSSPNTPGLRELQEKEALRKILSHLQETGRQTGYRQPLLLKIAPDLSTGQVDDVINLAIEIKLDGLVVSNTSTGRENLKTSESVLQKIGAGGLSGQPIKKRSSELLQYINERSNGKLTLIASGGIFTSGDAREKTAIGASLIQVWTGFIYEGPRIVHNILSSW